ERIMRDSPDDEPNIIAVLSAYVRGHAPRPLSAPAPSPGNKTAVFPQIATDIQAALTVLGRRPQPDQNRVDISQIALAGADLRDAHVSWADLRGADLRDAHLSSADLRGAHASENRREHTATTGTQTSRARKRSTSFEQKYK